MKPKVKWIVHTYESITLMNEFEIFIGEMKWMTVQKLPADAQFKLFFNS